MSKTRSVPSWATRRRSRRLLGSDATLFKMRDALCARDEDGNKVQIKKRRFPVFLTLQWVWNNKRVIVPGTNLVLETVGSSRPVREEIAIDEIGGGFGSAP